MLLQKIREMNRTGDKHERHQQILKQLTIHRPTKSVNQKQPAAERTDVLYDSVSAKIDNLLYLTKWATLIMTWFFFQEASHLQSISPLPADIESKGCMLLIVDLSSPGMVGDRRHGKRKHLYPAATKSHIYNTLVAWFLSLVSK